jgi:hypothetical protein
MLEHADQRRERIRPVDWRPDRWHKAPKHPSLGPHDLWRNKPGQAQTLLLQSGQSLELYTESEFVATMGQGGSDSTFVTFYPLDGMLLARPFWQNAFSTIGPGESLRWRRGEPKKELLFREGEVPFGYKRVSRDKHLRVELRDDGHVVVTDEGSKNGTRVRIPNPVWVHGPSD